ncbi:MAG: gliding motility-associated C-terminal domain-containing protein [Fluviicola sp.]|nr:gliding motility-associated C-terminal domain-containing protein [Fluviicola sp.]
MSDRSQVKGISSVLSNYNGEDVSCFDSTDGSVTISASGGMPNYTFEWFDVNLNFLGSNVILSDVGAGTYSVVVTDVNECQFTTKVTVNEPDLIVLNTLITSDYYGNGVSCLGANDGTVSGAVTGGTPSYSYSWNTVPTQNSVNASGLGVGVYTLTVIDINGCTTSSDIELTANPLPTINLPPFVYGCIGGSVLLDSHSEPGSDCVWNFSNGQSYNQCGPFQAYFPNVECYDVELTVTNSQGCISSVSADDFVCIKPNPIADFYSDDYSLTNIQSTANFWNTSSGAVSYLWDFGDGTQNETDFNVDHTFQSNDNFNITDYPITLNVTSEYGCKDSIIKYISINPELIFFVPNSFTPDGDKYNNTFKPIFSSGYSFENYSFLIFNRWGELIYEGSDINDSWDGTYLGRKCQDGVYVWKIEVKESMSAVKHLQTGHVSLLR